MSTEIAPKSPSSWSLLAGMVDWPSASLAEIMAHPRGRWLLPVALAILATIFSAVVTAPYLAVEAKAQMAAVLNRMPADQLAQMPKQIETFQTPIFIGATAVLTGLLCSLIGWVVRGRSALFRRADRWRRSGVPLASSLRYRGWGSHLCWRQSCSRSTC